MNNACDAIVIGAGHNGLTCAAYLARAGRRVLVLEANSEAGGAAVTREFSPGYSVSSCAHLLTHLHPKVINELELRQHGLQIAAADMQTLALCADGNHLVIGRDTVSGHGLSDTDKREYAKFQKKLRRYARLMQKTFLQRPPRLVHRNLKDLLALARLGLGVRLLGRDDMRELLRIGAINIYDVLQEDFDSELLKAAMGFDAVLGTGLGPRSPNSVLTYLYRLTGQLHGRDSAISLPRGGMGAVTEALAAAAKAAGVEIRTATRVSRILVEGDRAAGVETATGETIKCGMIISNADAKTTFLGLVGARNLETGFVRRVDNIRMQGKAAKLHLALNGMPKFSGVDDGSAGSRMLIAPSLTAIEQAFDQSKYGEYSDAPVMEISVPSVHDPATAPPGHHVMSVIVQYAPYELKTGWETQRDSFMQLVIDRIAGYAPGLKEQIVSSELLVPPDLEKQFNMTGGHWHHGELTLDQFMMLRPVPGAAQYAMPLQGLYLCGAGCHPGGGVMGLAGRNAAGEIIAGGKTA